MRRLTICLFVLMLAACRPIVAVPSIQVSSSTIPPAPSEDYRVYLPNISIGLAESASEPCVGSIIEQQLTWLFLTDPGQKRQHPACDPRLARVASHRAYDMITHKYFSHTDWQEHTPNYWAQSFGCGLPDFYPLEGNNIESIGLNYASASDAWHGWLNSPGHRAHVLGTDPFWAEQTSFGIAEAESSYGRVFVLITTPGCD